MKNIIDAVVTAITLLLMGIGILYAYMLFALTFGGN